MLKKAYIVNLILVISSIAFTFLLVEWGLRWYIANYGREDQKVLYLYSRDDINKLASRHTALPYLNYGLSSNYPENNSLGFRGAEIVMPKPNDNYRIVAVGGSTTFGSQNPNWENAYPAQLEKVLREEYGYTNVEVVNAGVINYTSWESLNNIQFHVADIDPDLVIFYEAMNDIPPRLIEPSAYRGLNLSRGIWAFDESPVSPSALYRFVTQRLGFGVRYDQFDTQFRRVTDAKTCGGVTLRNEVYYCNDIDMPIADLLAQNPPIYYERNLRLMVSSAESLGFELMFATWDYSPLPYPDDVGGKYFTYPHNQLAVAEHNAILEKVAQDTDTLLFDFASLMPEENQYWVDGMHVNEKGATLQAELFAQFIHEHQLVK